MIILGLDMATVTGWAVVHQSGLGAVVFDSGIKIYGGKNKNVWSLEKRLLHFRSDVQRMLSKYKPDCICYEQAHHRGGPATRSALGMETILRVESWEMVPVFAVHSSTLKKFATGSGNADKKEMIRAIEKIDYYRAVEDDNEADAVWLALWGGANAKLNQHGAVIIEKRVPLNKQSKRRTK